MPLATSVKINAVAISYSETIATGKKTLAQWNYDAFTMRRSNAPGMQRRRSIRGVLVFDENGSRWLDEDLPHHRRWANYPLVPEPHIGDIPK